MKSFTATDAKNQFGLMLENALVEGEVTIERNGRVVAHVISTSRRAELVDRGASDKLAASRVLPKP